MFLASGELAFPPVHRFAFVVPNSWLDVAYGYELQKYMVNNFKIVAILESRCEPWFEDAAVNTVVTILERCSEKTERDDHIVKFVKISNWIYHSEHILLGF